MGVPATFRRNLFFAAGIVYLAAVVFTYWGMLLALPFMGRVPAAPIYTLMVLAAELLLILGVGHYLLGRTILDPLDQLIGDVRRIAMGDYRHTIAPVRSKELVDLSESVTEMAGRLIRDQQMLADNVVSLENTNRELVVARDLVVRTERLASVGTLAAGLAHEVGNPLGAIIGYADVARARAAKENRDPELLDSIREECSRIDRIVRGLLDYARPKGREALFLPPRDVLEKVRDLLEHQGRWGDVEHRWDVDDELPEYARVDATRLEQVMVNLLLNALHALRDTPNPKVVVNVTSEAGESGRLPARRGGDPPEINYMHRRRVGTDSLSGGVDLLHTASTVLVISVADNGPGFPPEEVGRVFDPFYTTKDVGEGIGLGLAICARLIEGMDGEIQAGDSPEGGAVFTLRLPADGAMLSDELGEDPQ